MCIQSGYTVFYRGTVEVREKYQYIQCQFIHCVIVDKVGIFRWYLIKQYLVVSEFVIMRHNYMRISCSNDDNNNNNNCKRDFLFLIHYSSHYAMVSVSKCAVVENQVNQEHCELFITIQITCSLMKHRNRSKGDSV